MSKTILTIGIAFIGGCIVGAGAAKGVELMSRKFKKDIYYYEASEDEGNIDVTISENKLPDYVYAMKAVLGESINVSDISDTLVHFSFKATSEQHEAILRLAGIDYTVEEETV